jgi:hypothetical protein
MKKRLIIVFILLFITVAITLYSPKLSKNDVPSLSSELIYLGVIDGHDEYIFKIINSNETSARIEFYSDNELNLVIKGDAVPTDTLHNHLLSYEPKKQELILDPGEIVSYVIKVNRELLLNGSYELRVSLASKNTNVPLQKYLNSF